MEHNNERLRSQQRFRNYQFDEMPDPWDAPEKSSGRERFRSSISLAMTI